MEDRATQPLVGWKAEFRNWKFKWMFIQESALRVLKKAKGKALRTHASNSYVSAFLIQFVSIL